MLPQYLESAFTGPSLEVTGMGITSCLGNTLDDVADNLKNGFWDAPVPKPWGETLSHGGTPIAGWLVYGWFIGVVYWGFQLVE
jgi:3-oxoacyl-(acyl-carrier-protein) synthase